MNGAAMQVPLHCPVAANHAPPGLVTNMIGAMHGDGRFKNASIFAFPPPSLAKPVVAGN